jgi:hypothetical protein
VIAQLLEAGIVPPVNLMPTSPIEIVPPELSASVPPQVLEVVVLMSVIAPGMVGNTSVNVAPVRAVGVRLASVIVKVVLVLVATGLTEKLLLMSGTGTESVALAEALLEPALVVSLPTGIVLV